MLFVPGNSYKEQPTKFAKNCTSKFTFKKHIKSHLLASQFKDIFYYQIQQFQNNYIGI